MVTLAAVMRSTSHHFKFVTTSCGKFFSGFSEKLSEGKFSIVRFSRASSSLNLSQFSVRMDIFDSG